MHQSYILTVVLRSDGSGTTFIFHRLSDEDELRMEVQAGSRL